MDFNLPEELKMVQTLARDFVKDQLIPLEREVLGRDSDLEGARRRLDPEKEAELVRTARETGLWGLGIPEDLGGAGLGVLAACLVEEEMARTIVPFNLGDVTPILFDCSEEQKAEYLIPVIEGRKTACLALVEPGEGDDPLSVKMAAGKENGYYVLNGTKIAFGDNHPADFAMVFAATGQGGSSCENVTCFLVDKESPGFSTGELEPASGWKAQVAKPAVLNFKGCKVPKEKILGEEGRAFRLGKEFLVSRRIIRSARCIGAAVRLLEISVEHARSWQSFGRTIDSWPGIRQALAEMATGIQAARLMVYQAACRADEGLDVKYEAAMAKVAATEMLERVADRSVMIRGGPAPARELSLALLCRNMLSGRFIKRSLELHKNIIANGVLRE